MQFIYKCCGLFLTAMGLVPDVVKFLLIQTSKPHVDGKAIQIHYLPPLGVSTINRHKDYRQNNISTGRKNSNIIFKKWQEKYITQITKQEQQHQSADFDLINTYLSVRKYVLRLVHTVRNIWRIMSYSFWPSTERKRSLFR